MLHETTECVKRKMVCYAGLNPIQAVLLYSSDSRCHLNFGHCIYYLQLLTQAEALLMVEIWFIVYSSDKNPACYQVF